VVKTDSKVGVSICLPKPVKHYVTSKEFRSNLFEKIFPGVWPRTITEKNVRKNDFDFTFRTFRRVAAVTSVVHVVVGVAEDASDRLSLNLSGIGDSRRAEKIPPGVNFINMLTLSFYACISSAAQLLFHLFAQLSQYIQLEVTPNFYAVRTMPCPSKISINLLERKSCS